MTTPMFALCYNLTAANGPHVRVHWSASSIGAHTMEVLLDGTFCHNLDHGDPDSLTGALCAALEAQSIADGIGGGWSCNQGPSGVFGTFFLAKGGVAGDVIDWIEFPSSEIPPSLFGLDDGQNAPEPGGATLWFWDPETIVCGNWVARPIGHRCGPRQGFCHDIYDDVVVATTSTSKKTKRDFYGSGLQVHLVITGIPGGAMWRSPALDPEWNTSLGLGVATPSECVAWDGFKHHWMQTCDASARYYKDHTDLAKWIEIEPGEGAAWMRSSLPVVNVTSTSKYRATIDLFANKIGESD